MHFSPGLKKSSNLCKSSSLDAPVFAPDAASRSYGQAERIYHFSFPSPSSLLPLQTRTASPSAAMRYLLFFFSLSSLKLSYIRRKALNINDELYSFMEKIPTWIEKLLLPKLKEITGETKALHTRIDSMGNEITRLRNEAMPKLEAADNKVAILDTKVDSLKSEVIPRFDALNTRFDSLEARLPVREKISELEARLTGLEKKLADKPKKSVWKRKTQKDSLKKRKS